MYVARLELADFRNYRAASVELAPGATVFVGPNGQGKTNLVEAIVLLASGSSHRVAGDAALIRHGKDRAIIRALLKHGERTVTVEAELNRGAPNRILVNRSPVRSKEARRYLDAVIFAPEDLGLVRDEPSGRRRFLDALLVMRQPRLAGVLADYERVVRQRNSLLKSARAARITDATRSTLDIWDAQLSAIGAEITAARIALVDELRPFAVEAYATIAGEGQRLELELELTGAADPEEFTTRLAARRGDELDRAVTLVGPHRDDLRIVLNDMPARTHASHGESWSTALSLRLGSAELLRRSGPAGDPIIILDDVFAELDARRRERLIGAVADYEQVLVTAAVQADVPDGLAGPMIRIRAGEIVGDPDGDDGTNASGGDAEDLEKARAADG